MTPNDDAQPMFDVGTLIQLACLDVQAKAREQGRDATSEEYRAVIKETWDAWMEASVAGDMARAGFVKTETGWKSPGRGFWARLLGN